MNIGQYLQRIQYTGKRTAELETLNNLQQHHLLNIPFENLDIHYGPTISLDLNRIYDKVINNGRGGFCYELNGLFYELLTTLGFKAKRISARVYSTKKKAFGQPFDHLAILVEIDEQTYLSDVGYGEFALKPIRFELNEIWQDQRGQFIIEKDEDEYFRVSKLVGDQKQPEYIFQTKAREMHEFEDMCTYQQTSPDSSFTQRRLITLPHENGRVTITANRLKITAGEQVILDQEMENESEFWTNLLKYFNITEKQLHG